MEIQHSKLRTLRSRITREMTVGDDPDAIDAALAYLLPAESPQSSPPAAIDAAERSDPSDATGFDLRDAEREIADLTRRLGDAEARAASLHYRVATLATDNRDYEMRCTALTARVRALESDLRALRNGSAVSVPAPCSDGTSRSG